jgi:hypothetical protein
MTTRPGQVITLVITNAQPNDAIIGTFSGVQADTAEELDVSPGSPQVAGFTIGIVAGEFQVSDLKVTGLTGATAASRYVGATPSGAPISGTFLLGDFVIDQTGIVWICTAAGTPGTWQAAPAQINALKVTGLTGATAASRYVGATTAGGPPTSGTFLLGDWIVDELYGIHWTCITAGTPGTWRPSGPAVISDQTLGATTATVTLPASGTIPNYFRWLELACMNVRCNQATRQTFGIQFNGDGGGNYARLYQLSESSAIPWSGSTNLADTGITIGVASDNTTAAFAGEAHAKIMDYAQANHRIGVVSMAEWDSGTAGMFYGTGDWKPAVLAAITSITVLTGGSFLADSRFILKGQ